MSRPEALNVAEAKKRFSELLGRVAFGGEVILITRRGRPMARLVPLEKDASADRPAGIRGWLDDDDPFFEEIDRIVADRISHPPRMLDAEKGDER